MNRFAFWGVLALFGTLAPHCAIACETVAPQGFPPIGITDEAAVIVWDKAKGVEHFIRRASFESKAPDFGFLVPTPSKPELAEAQNAVFDDLQTALEPKRITKTGWRANWQPLIFSLSGGAGEDDSVGLANKSAADGVEILESRQIAGYDATVLSADNPQALAAWLRARNYSNNPALIEWLAPYVAAKWKITAFKIAKQDSQATAVSSSLVRMSFRTARPYFPYREASARRDSGTSRLLRVYFLSDARVEGTIELPKASRGWPGETIFSAPLEVPLQSTVVRRLGLQNTDLPPQVRLTAFEDNSSPRPGVGDVYFSPAPNQGVIAPAPIVTDKTRTLWIPPDVVALLVLVIWNLRRRRGASVLPPHPNQA